uniref:Uncharacterized protein n=1 Tax=Timema poppense TaxID=170557 RepID=A0A7R9CKZ8_TIMPO|nr:unnamed protein product [Timema poppensis]
MPLILDSMIGMLNDLHPKEVFLDQNFTTSLAHSDPRQVSGSFRAGCYHPWCNQASMDSGVSDIHQNADEFKVYNKPPEEKVILVTRNVTETEL